VIEIMINTPRIADLIKDMELGEIKDVIEKGANYGMRSFDQHLVQLYFEGVIEEKTVYEFADSVANAKLKIRAKEAGQRVTESRETQDDKRALGNLADINLVSKDDPEEDPGSSLL
jgi:Tfp pilus assembly ATPase PilU